MSDPLDALRRPDAPIAPDPGFAADLRHRVATALAEGADEGGAVPPTEDHPPTTETTAASDATMEAGVADLPRAERVPAVGERPRLSAYLAVHDARRALRWYVGVLDGRMGTLVEMPDGRLGHAEVVIGDSLLMMADEFPEMGLRGPLARGGTTVSLVLDVPDVDAAFARAVAAGATIEREPGDMPYGFRAAAVVDPFGHRWMFEAPLGDGGPSAG